MDLDYLADVIANLTREMVNQRECFGHEMAQHRKQMQAWQDDADKWRATILENAKEQLSALEGISRDTGLMTQPLEQCERYLKDLVDHFEPPRDDF